ncbi:hypothetical protein SEPCBS57363_006284 [Sporothrix epigloea]|uniref:non-specific serine/threonine protein kinase n=1 Tax=Sporothrix epigloea TaxID=1892477 RepID=A0ABP0E283_9PEZI
MATARLLTRRSLFASRLLALPSNHVLRRPVFSALPPPALPHRKPRDTGRSPRMFPKSGFEVIKPDVPFEEETLPAYESTLYYPMRIGDVVGGHYQVVAKLGFGSRSTVWLASDLSEKCTYRALKVHTRNAFYDNEMRIYDHLRRPIPQEVEDKDIHPGRKFVRHLEDSFTLEGPHGQHAVFVMAPLGVSMDVFLTAHKPGSLTIPDINEALLFVVVSLDLLHSADVVHTNIRPDNLFTSLVDDSVLTKVEEAEATTPSPRKEVGDRARIGHLHTGQAMPLLYRAPEVILKMPWGKPIDIWSLGMLSLQAWTLLEPKSLFDIPHASLSESELDAQHLAAMTALLGPPPKQFRDRSEESAKYWNEQGVWHGPAPLPQNLQLADLVTAVDGVQKAFFVNFLQCVLTWLPEERLTVNKTFLHPWLHSNDEVD